MRKKKLINKKFQLTLAFQVISLSVISFTLLICFVLILMSTSKNAVLSEQAAAAEKALATQEKIIKSFMEYSRRVNDDRIMVAVELVHNDHTQSMTVLKESLATLKASAGREKRIMFAALVVMIAHVIVLFLFLINKTNAIYGPIYVMSRHINDIMNKKEPSVRQLRRKDEFVGFYHDFLKMMGRIQIEKNSMDGNGNGKGKKRPKAKSRLRDASSAEKSVPRERDAG